MGQAIIWAGLALLLSLQCGSASKLVCYFTNWAQYRPGEGRFLPDDIDPHLCTHLIYAFAGMSDHEITTVQWNDVTLFEAFNGLKAKNRNLKTLLSIGGSNMGTERFSHMAASAANRWTFVRSVVQFLRTHEFDGLDVAWIYPGRKDKRHFTSLIQELATAFEKEAQKTKKEKLLLSIAVSAGRINIDTGYEVDKISKIVDFINLMTYDFHGAWEKTTGHVSPLNKGRKDLRSAAYNNVDYAMNHWKDNGAPAEKLMVGFGAYAHTLTLSNPSNHGLAAPTSGPRAAGAYIQSAGTLAYFEVCTFLKTGATIVWNAPQDVPYAYKGNQWIGYDNPKSFAIKAKWLLENNFGGAMVWAIDLDDFTGTFCGEGKYPLMNSLKSVLGKKAHSNASPLHFFLSDCKVPATTPGTSANQPAMAAPSKGSGSSSGSSSCSNFCSSRANGLYPDPSNNHAFYHCMIRKTYLQFCQASLVFNSSCSCCNWA
ncbi:acidic mammalian chitinase-like isoform X1 [Natator depressus]|uniref:acidic mammalian chitinase-like isoform X1 n=1 Tax=Natator depressus TaxID=27790 RepID=UPI003EC0A9F5